MEVGHHAVCQTECVRIEDELAGPSIVGIQRIGRTDTAFDCPHYGCSDGADPFFGQNRLIHHIAGFSRDDELLAVHFVFAEIFYLHWAVGAQSHMKGDGGEITLLISMRLTSCLLKCSPAIGAATALFVFGENGLVALSIFGFYFPFDVFGQRRLAKVFEFLSELLVSPIKRKRQRPAP